MAKKPEQPQGELFDKDSLKKAARREAAKWPPIGPRERRELEGVWRRVLAEARHPHRRPPPYAEPHLDVRPDGIAARAAAGYLPHRENHELTRSSAAYWASHRKCAACPGPNRRQSKHPFGQGPNTGHTPDGEPT